VANSSGTVSKL